MYPEKQRIPVAGEVEIRGLAFKFNFDLTNTTSYTADAVLIPLHLRYLSKADILDKIMQYFNSELLVVAGE